MTEETSFTLDDQFEIDEVINTLKSESDEYEYYTKNKLAVKSINEYKTILEKELSSNKDLIIVRYFGKDFDEKQFS